jgi:hypothetical protein
MAFSAIPLKIVAGHSCNGDDRMMQTVECSFTQLQPALGQQIAGQFSTGEQPLICCETRGIEEPYSGKFSDAYVITQRQIITARIRHLGMMDNIFSGRQFDNWGSSSMYLADIVSIYESTGRQRDVYVSIKGHGETGLYLKFELGQVTQKFVAILRDATNRARGMTSQTQANPADRLRELAKLHQEGFISDAEFEQKRKEILGKL